MQGKRKISSANNQSRKVNNVRNGEDEGNNDWCLVCLTYWVMTENLCE